MPAYAISLAIHLTIVPSGIGDRFPSYRFRIAGRLLPFDHFIHMDNVTDWQLLPVPLN